MLATPLEHLEGKYEILDRLSEGGMGAVYLVRHRLLEEIRVIKTMRPQLTDDATLRARFLREARTAVKLRHPNIAQMYDFTMDEDGNAFIVMEYIDGIGLDELLRRIGPPSLSLALAIAHDSLAALGHLHRKGLVHRDISPDNLMLTRNDDGGPLVKMIDLGLAKALEEDSQLTMSGTFMGKVRYASPEQFRSQEGAAVDHRSDLYSLGVVLYELLTGSGPIRGSSLPGLIRGHLFEPPIPFETSDSQGRVPPELRHLLLRMLAKVPEERPGGTDDLLEVVHALQEPLPPAKEEVERALTLPTRTTSHIPVVRPGSTQARLNRHFAAMTTPAHGNGTAIASVAELAPPPPPPPLSQAQETSPPGPAPSPPPVVVTHSPSPAEPSPAREHRAHSLAMALAAIEDTLAHGDLAGAERALGVAFRVFGDAEPLRLALHRLETLRHHHRQARVEAMSATIRQLADDGALGRAITETLEALVDWPEDPDLETLLRELRRREAAVVVMDALARGDFPGADRALTLAEHRFGSDEDLTELRWRVDALLAER